MIGNQEQNSPVRHEVQIPEGQEEMSPQHHDDPVSPDPVSPDPISPDPTSISDRTTDGTTVDTVPNSDEEQQILAGADLFVDEQNWSHLSAAMKYASILAHSLVFEMITTRSLMLPN